MEDCFSDGLRAFAHFFLSFPTVCTCLCAYVHSSKDGNHIKEMIGLMEVNLPIKIKKKKSKITLTSRQFLMSIKVRSTNSVAVILF